MRRSIASCAALAVGEGKAERVLLEHIKQLYLPWGCGTTLKIQEGLGKGAKGVIEYAISVSANSAYDRKIVLLDTDTDWDEKVRKLAKDAGLEVVESTPCLERWLLAIHGDAKERNSKQHKKEFEKRFKGSAHDQKIISKHFPKETLDAERRNVVTLERLLKLLGV